MFASRGWGFGLTLGWLYLFGYSLKTGISWFYILCILVFALRCWTVPYYGTVSCVYYVFLDIPLIWACRFCVKFIYSLLVHQGTRQGLK